MRKVMMFVLATSLAAFAQRGGMGMGHASAMGVNHGNHGSLGSHGSVVNGQKPLPKAKAGVWSMLEKKTGMTETQLQQAYQSSKFKNFGQFVAANVVASNMGLKGTALTTFMTNAQSKSLGYALQQAGVNKSDAKLQVRKANQQIKDAEKNS